VSYRSVPPVSVTSTISSRTARISFPLLVVSRRNSAKVCDMIIIVSFISGGFLSPPCLKPPKGHAAVERFDLKTISERHPCLNFYSIAVL